MQNCLLVIERWGRRVLYGWHRWNVREGKSKFGLPNLIYVISPPVTFFWNINWHINRGIPVLPDTECCINIESEIYFFPWMNFLILIIMTKCDESGSKYYDGLRQWNNAMIRTAFYVACNLMSYHCTNGFHASARSIQ